MMGKDRDVIISTKKEKYIDAQIFYFESLGGYALRTGFLMKRFFIIAFVFLLFPLVTFGQTSPFKLNVTLLKDRVPAGDLIPVTVTIAIDSKHYVYKNQIKVESADPAQFTVASTELPAEKIKYDQFLEKEVEIYEGQVEIKSLLQLSKNISTGLNNIKLKCTIRGVRRKSALSPRLRSLYCRYRWSCLNGV